ncbi:hypothetical protein CHELA1G11_13184 [Hyphomicrobiales bacterium]|nr:hypothetical protein CHELA1G2_11127 [Hyphomicrobiales bacterium]CAH1669893.1 hypothetical protein CHELA1G11_13184 [Hyphomicrobiales bacterium]
MMARAPVIPCRNPVDRSRMTGCVPCTSVKADVNSEFMLAVRMSVVLGLGKAWGRNGKLALMALPATGQAYAVQRG